MKKYIAVIAVVIALVSFTSCNVKKIDLKEWVNKTDNERFEQVLDDDGIIIFMDKETGVLYMWRGFGYRGGLTVMLDADGKPLIGNIEDEEESEDNDDTEIQ